MQQLSGLEELPNDPDGGQRAGSGLCALPEARRWVAINPYWVFISVRGYRGWMASYYIDNGANWIDDVPACA